MAPFLRSPLAQNSQINGQSPIHRHIGHKPIRGSIWESMPSQPTAPGEEARPRCSRGSSGPGTTGPRCPPAAPSPSAASACASSTSPGRTPQTGPYRPHPPPRGWAGVSHIAISPKRMAAIFFLGAVAESRLAHHRREGNRSPPSLIGGLASTIVNRPYLTPARGLPHRPSGGEGFDTPPRVSQNMLRSVMVRVRCEVGIRVRVGAFIYYTFPLRWCCPCEVIRSDRSCPLATSPGVGR